MKKKEKSLNKTRYKLIKYGAVLTGILVIGTAVGIASVEHGSDAFGRIINAIPLLGNKTVVTDVNAELAKNGFVSEYENDDRYVKVNYNPDYKEVVFIDSDIIAKPVNIYNAVNEIKEYDNFKNAKKMIYKIPEIELNQDEDLIFEQECDNISLYLVALQKINENNPALKADLVKYNKNYNSYLTSYNRYNEYLLVYEAIVYQRMLDNNLDIIEALNELNILVTNCANDINYEIELNDYPELVKGLNDGENIKDIYLPLAYDLHRINCSKEHDNYDNMYECEDLLNNKIKTY